eukprot:PhM_4_TR6222/c0_g1_i2/m.30199
MSNAKLAEIIESNEALLAENDILKRHIENMKSAAAKEGPSDHERLKELEAQLSSYKLALDNSLSQLSQERAAREAAEAALAQTTSELHNVKGDLVSSESRVEALSADLADMRRDAASSGDNRDGELNGLQERMKELGVLVHVLMREKTDLQQQLDEALPAKKALAVLSKRVGRVQEMLAQMKRAETLDHLLVLDDTVKIDLKAKHSDHNVVQNVLAVWREALLALSDARRCPTSVTQ